jgi:hypothetical protein
MHIQAKSKAAKSPADLVAFLEVLANADPGDVPINVEGVTGAGLETGGGIVFAMSHDQHDQGVARLIDAGYEVEENTDLYAEEIVVPPRVGLEDWNQPGVLLRIIENAKASPVANGRPIDTILVGARTGEPGRFYVQVSFIDAAFFDPSIP